MKPAHAVVGYLNAFPEGRPEGKPHPYAVTPDRLLNLARASKDGNVAGMLAQGLCRVPPSKMGEIRLAMAFRGLLVRYDEYLTRFDEHIACEVRDAIAEARNIEEKVKCLGKELSRHRVKWEQTLREEERNADRILRKRAARLRSEEAKAIVGSFRYVRFLSPPSIGLNPIGAENILKGLDGFFKPEFAYASSSRDPICRDRDGIAFIVEAGIAYGGGCPRGADLIGLTNRAPLLNELTRAVKSMDWKRYGVSDVEAAPLAILVNVVSSLSIPLPHRADVLNEVEVGLKDLGGNLKRHLACKNAIKRMARRRCEAHRRARAAGVVRRIRKADRQRPPA